MLKSGPSRDLLGDLRALDMPVCDDFCDGEAADVGYGTQSSTSSESELWRRFQANSACGSQRASPRPSPMAGRAAGRMAVANSRYADGGGGCDSVMSLASTASSCSRGAGDDDGAGSCSSDSLAGSMPRRRPLRGRLAAAAIGSAADPSKDSAAHRSTPCSFDESGHGYGEFLSDSCASDLGSAAFSGAGSAVAAHRQQQQLLPRTGGKGACSQAVAANATSLNPATSAAAGELRSASPLTVRPQKRGGQPQPRSGNDVFVGREWAYDKVARVLQQLSDFRGVVVTGGPGTGKSAFLEQLYQLSPLGDGHGGIIQSQDVLVCLRRTLENGRMNYSNSPSSSPAGTLIRAAAAAGSSTTAVTSCIDVGVGVDPAAVASMQTHMSLRSVASQVVAYHACRADDATTCSPADLVRGVACQLMRSPRFGAGYYQVLSESGSSPGARPPRTSCLNAAECMRDPLAALVRTVFEPLATLREQGAIDGGIGGDMIILVDGLCEAELHRADAGADGIASFLARALTKCPPFIRFVVSVRTAVADIAQPLCFFPISFDSPAMASSGVSTVGATVDGVCHDITGYITYRIYASEQLRANMCIGSTSAASSSSNDSGSFQARVSQHLQTLSRGSFLYCKLVLDLIERGQLVLKTANFKIVPVTLGEVFLLSMNLRFPGLRAFERALPLLNVCLAALQPPSAEELYDRVNAGYLDTCVPWDDFRQRLASLEGLLIESSGSGGEQSVLTFFHPTFREWLARRDDGDSTKFLCDVKAGHASIALYMSRCGGVLTEAVAVELGHHILKAHLYKGGSQQHQSLASQQQLQQQRLQQAEVRAADRTPLPVELQACWMALATSNPTTGLTCPANLFLPNVNVSRLLLLAGGDPNARTDFYGRAPLLCVAAREGFTDVVSLLLEFGAVVDGATAADGQTPLCYASARGHLNVVKALKDHGAQITYLDNAGRCPLMHAAMHGHLEVVKFLVGCLRTVAWPPSQLDALVSALVSASTRGHTDVIEYLLGVMCELGVGSWDSADAALGETALTAACLYGRRNVVELLIARGANTRKPNSKSFTPLLCAAKSGQGAAAEALLSYVPAEALSDVDKHGRTALAVAAAEGHVEFVRLLLSKGVPVDAEDKEGLSALSWACVKGRPRVARQLLEEGASLEHVDKAGRGPLDLAVLSGDAELVHLLVEFGASTERADASGVRPLDRAIELRHLAAARCLLRKNARLTQATWAAAGNDAGAMHLLLAKLLDDGSALYRKGRVKDAAARYQYALKHCPCTSTPAAAAANNAAADDGSPSLVAGTSAIGGEQPYPSDGPESFASVRHCAMVSLSKCCRKLGDTAKAVELATAALQLPWCTVNASAAYEAHCCRAQALRDSGQLDRAFEDLAAAERLGVPGGASGLRRLAARMRDESKRLHPQQQQPAPHLSLAHLSLVQPQEHGKRSQLAVASVADGGSRSSLDENGENDNDDGEEDEEYRGGGSSGGCHPVAGSSECSGVERLAAVSAVTASVRSHQLRLANGVDNADEHDAAAAAHRPVVPSVVVSAAPPVRRRAEETAL